MIKTSVLVALSVLGLTAIASPVVAQDRPVMTRRDWRYAEEACWQINFYNGLYLQSNLDNAIDRLLYVYYRIAREQGFPHKKAELIAYQKTNDALRAINSRISCPAVGQLGQ